MEIQSLNSDLLVSFNARSIIFKCEKCGRVIEDSYYNFKRRKHLKCLSCIMKEVSNKTSSKDSIRIKSREKRKSIERQNKIKSLMSENNLTIYETYIDENDELNYQYKCNLCGKNGIWNEYQRYSHINGITQKPYCKACSSNGVSKQESEIYDFIKQHYTKDIIRNSRQIIPPRELDIFLPDLKLAIEFDGLHWHKGNNYDLLNKTRICNSAGIELFHIFENEWKNEKNQLIIKNILKSLLIGQYGEIESNYFFYHQGGYIYFNKRFPRINITYKNSKTINPKKLYFCDDKSQGFIDYHPTNFIYDCGYIIYSDREDDILIRDNELINFEVKTPDTLIEVNCMGDIIGLSPIQKIKFTCPECNKDFEYLAGTLQKKEKFICGRCSQGKKMSIYQKTIGSGFHCKDFIYPKNRKSRKK